MWKAVTELGRSKCWIKLSQAFSIWPMGPPCSSHIEHRIGKTKDDFFLVRLRGWSKIEMKILLGFSLPPFAIDSIARPHAAVALMTWSEAYDLTSWSQAHFDWISLWVERVCESQSVPNTIGFPFLWLLGGEHQHEILQCHLISLFCVDCCGRLCEGFSGWR